MSKRDTDKAAETVYEAFSELRDAVASLVSEVCKHIGDRFHMVCEHLTTPPHHPTFHRASVPRLRPPAMLPKTDQSTTPMPPCKPPKRTDYAQLRELLLEVTTQRNELKEAIKEHEAWCKEHRADFNLNDLALWKHVEGKE